jgi:hypothetical protein
MRMQTVMTHGTGLDTQQGLMLTTVFAPSTTENPAFGPLGDDLLALRN